MQLTAGLFVYRESVAGIPFISAVALAAAFAPFSFRIFPGLVEEDSLVEVAVRPAAFPARVSLNRQASFVVRR